MINTIFNDINYELLPKQREIWDRYLKIIQWGRREPIRFVQDFIGLELTDYQKWLFCNMWVSRESIILCSRNTGKSFVCAPYIAARSLLFPNHKTYIVSNTSAQSAETMGKLESLAMGQIGSAVGLSNVFMENAKSANAKASPFTHGKEGSSVELFNGSEVHSLPAVPENIRGYRSSLTIIDEAAFVPKTLLDAVLPFASQNSNFITGKGLNTEIYPKQMPNQNIMLSSASDINSEMYAHYKEGFRQMLMGNRDFFVADLDWHISTAPFMNGKPMEPLVSPEVVEAAYKVDIFRAEREYGNIWSGENSKDCLVTRAALEKNSKPMYPVFENEGGRKYIIAMDPSAKIDSAVIGVAELFRDEDRGLMIKIVNCRNLLEVLANGEKMIIQRPEQIEILKKMICNYNNGTYTYDGIDQIIIDSGGGGFELSQFIMNEWRGPDHKMYPGFIDINDPYMKLRADDYPTNSDKLKLFNFKKSKTSGYEHCQQMLNQGLVILPKSLNARNEIEFDEETESGEIRIRYEKPSLKDMDALIQIDLCKTELLNMEKQKKANGNIVFDLSSQAKSKNGHDDHCDVIMMLCDRLFELRAEEALEVEHPQEDFGKVFTQKHRNSNSRNNDKRVNPFVNKNNPFRR